MWLDGAHNPAAAAALASELPPGAHLLVGVAARKDAARFLAAFADAPCRTLTVAVPGESPWGSEPGVIDDPVAALEVALDALPPGGTLAVTGSFYLAGLLRPLLRARSAEAAPTADSVGPRYARRP